MNRKLLAPLVMILASVYALTALLDRPVWFDEAITVLNFLLPAEKLSDLYWNYAIPNNHILYSMSLWCWNVLLPEGGRPEIFWRFGSFLIAVITLFAIGRGIAGRWGGREIRYGVLTFLGVSIPFAIYGTALRGYGLSACLTVAAIAMGWQLVRQVRWAVAGYFLVMVLLMGVLPSNLAVAGGIGLYFLPILGKSFWKKKEFYCFLLIPFLAWGIFYGPLLDQVIKGAQLREGWSEKFLAALYSYSGCFWAMGPLALLALAGVKLRKQNLWKLLCHLGIFLIILLTCCLLPVAPFPRTFFPMWILFFMLAGEGVGRFAAYGRVKKWKFPVGMLLLLLALVWGFVERLPAEKLADSCLRQAGQMDDFFAPYYCRDTFTVVETVAEFQNRFGSKTPPVWIDFNADPWAVMYYGLLAGIDIGNWKFDGPGVKQEIFPRGCLIIVPAETSGNSSRLFPDSANKELIFATSYHLVYRNLENGRR